VRFEWDDQKNAINLKKHGVEFDLAALAFLDPHCLMEEERVVDGEVRWQTIGTVRGHNLLLVAHLLDHDEEEDEEVVRNYLSERCDGT